MVMNYGCLEFCLYYVFCTGNNNSKGAKGQWCMENILLQST